MYVLVDQEIARGEKEKNIQTVLSASIQIQFRRLTLENTSTMKTYVMYVNDGWSHTGYGEITRRIT